MEHNHQYPLWIWLESHASMKMAVVLCWMFYALVHRVVKVVICQWVLTVHHHDKTVQNVTNDRRPLESTKQISYVVEIVKIIFNQYLKLFKCLVSLKISLFVGIYAFSQLRLYPLGNPPVVDVPGEWGLRAGVVPPLPHPTFENFVND